MNKPALKISFLSRFLPLFLTLALSLPAGVYPEPSRRALRPENAIDAGLEEKIGRALSQTKSAVGLEENFADKVRQRVVQELENFFSSYERRSSYPAYSSEKDWFEFDGYVIQGDNPGRALVKANGEWWIHLHTIILDIGLLFPLTISSEGKFIKLGNNVMAEPAPSQRYVNKNPDQLEGFVPLKGLISDEKITSLVLGAEGTLRYFFNRGFEQLTQAMQTNGHQMVLGEAIAPEGAQGVFQILILKKIKKSQESGGLLGKVRFRRMDTRTGLEELSKDTRTVEKSADPSRSGLEEVTPQRVLGQAGREVAAALTPVFNGSRNQLRDLMRTIGELASVQNRPVAIFFDPELVPGSGLEEKENLLLGIEGNVQGGRWPPDVPLHLELFFEQRSDQSAANGYRVIHVGLEEGKSGTLSLQALLLVSLQAYRAAAIQEANTTPFSFLVDPVTYAGLEQIDYSTFAVGLEELRAA